MSETEIGLPRLEVAIASGRLLHNDGMEIHFRSNPFGLSNFLAVCPSFETVLPFGVCAFFVICFDVRILVISSHHISSIICCGST